MLQNTSIVYLQVFCRRLVPYCLQVQAFPMSLKVCKCSKLALSALHRRVKSRECNASLRHINCPVYPGIMKFSQPRLGEALQHHTRARQTRLPKAAAKNTRRSWDSILWLWLRCPMYFRALGRLFPGFPPFSPSGFVCFIVLY